MNDKKETREYEYSIRSGPHIAKNNQSDGCHELAEGTRIDRYLVLASIGKGGMGAVYKAYDPELDRRIAIKILDLVPHDNQEDSLALSRMLREGQALARLSHPNVISVYDVGSYQTGMYIAMEYVEGKTLRDWIEAKSPTQEKILEVFLAAGRGLQAAHSQGIIHRDFKPENLLIGNAGQVKVLDFGLARSVGIEEQVPENEQPLSEIESQSGNQLLSQPLTQVGALIGTTAYMAPEHFLSEELDEKTDQFSFCVALFEALYGSNPFEGSRLTEFRQNVIQGRVRIPDGLGVPRWIQNVIMRGLSVSKADRYQTIFALLDDLERNPEQVRRQRTRVRRRRLLVFGLLLFMIGVPFFVWYDFRYGSIHGCKQRAEYEIVKIWNTDSRSATKNAFFESKTSFAENVWFRVSKAFDKYAADWIQIRSELCELSWEAKQSGEFFRVKKRCLDKRLAEFKKLLNIFFQADAGVIEKAIQAVSSLSPATQCLSPKSFTSKLALPNEKVAAEVEENRDKLLTVKLLQNTGKYQQGKSLLELVLTQADKLGYRPLLAEALYWAGRLNEKLGKYEVSGQFLKRAVWEAVEAEHLEIVVLASIHLVWVVGYRLTRAEEGLSWGRTAKVTLGLLGWPPELVDIWNKEMGSVYYGQGNEQKALEHYQKALEMREKLYGKDHPEVAIVLSNIGVVLWSLGESERALEFHMRALKIKENVLGLGHPGLADDLVNIGMKLFYTNQIEKASKYLQRALLIMENSLGKEHPQMAWPLSALGEVDLAKGKLTQAIVKFRQTREVCKKGICNPEPEARAYFGLARAIWARDKDRLPALLYAEKAQKIYANNAKFFVQELKEVDAWIARHRK